MTTSLRALFAAALALLASCASLPPAPPLPPGPAAEGRVSRDGVGVPGAEVLLLDPQFQLTPDAPPAARGLTGPDGAFRLPVPDGTYLAVARAPGAFSYFGRNPLRVSGGITGVHLPLLPAPAALREAAGAVGEGIRGRVLHAGAPVEGARVFAYLDAARGLRGPGYAVSEPTGPDGAFELPLPPGTYFVVARFRPGGWRAGNLAPGDYFGVAGDFPATLGAGEILRTEVETVEVPSREQMGRFQGAFARLSGRVVDGAGRPLAGFRVCLYPVPQLLDRPLAISEPTGPDGTFVLEVAETGTVYLGAREELGGPPVPGERVGFYRGPRGAQLDLAPGERHPGLVVVVQAVP